jgi:hypothetical protein
VTLASPRTRIIRRILSVFCIILPYISYHSAYFYLHFRFACKYVLTGLLFTGTTCLDTITLVLNILVFRIHAVQYSVSKWLLISHFDTSDIPGQTQLFRSGLLPFSFNKFLCYFCINVIGDPGLLVIDAAPLCNRFPTF